MSKHPEDKIEAIRQDFVQGIVENNIRSYPTIEELSKRYEIPSITLYRKSSSQDWKEQRTKFQRDLQNEIDRKKQSQLAKDSVNFDDNNLKIAKALQNEIIALLSFSNKQRQEKERPFFSPSSLNSLSLALSTCQRVGRLALGESTENTNITNESTVTEAYELIEQIISKSRSDSKSELH